MTTVPLKILESHVTFDIRSAENSIYRFWK